MIFCEYFNTLRDQLENIQNTKDLLSFLNTFIIISSNKCIKVSFYVEKLHKDKIIFYIKLCKDSFNLSDIHNVLFHLSANDQHVALCDNICFEFSRNNNYLNIDPSENVAIKCEIITKELTSIKHSNMYKILMNYLKVFDHSKIQKWSLPCINNFNILITTFLDMLKYNKGLLIEYQKKISFLVHERLWKMIIYICFLKVSFESFMHKYYAPYTGSGFKLQRNHFFKIKQSS